MICLTSTISGISEMERVDRCISDIAKNSGTQALEELYNRTKDAVYGYALSILKNTHDAEDVLHDCYICVWNSARDYTSEGKPMAWMFSIARNLCLMRIRGRNRFSDAPEEDWMQYLEANDSVSVDDRIVLERCLTELSDDEREIIMLHALTGLKHREIAEITERPLSTVLSKYRRALKKLRGLLDEEDGNNG
ncbi:MAG: RNA polymerase sigma factor [Oscillospiraceae bacterium]|nr:RNA polymerase sigma factor [Oscillospiraceae bacterium]